MFALQFKAIDCLPLKFLYGLKIFHLHYKMTTSKVSKHVNMKDITGEAL